ncbi:SpoIID/LytB domain-containing protein [bacterium]|nr:SpoIID/LytB domain-containing protein [bacterium]
MGIKTLKKIFLGLAIFSLVFVSSEIFAQNTKQSVNKYVRVAIGNQNFQNYVYQTTTVFGTSDISVYDKKNDVLIAEFPADTFVEISMRNNTFEAKTTKTELNTEENTTQVVTALTDNDIVILCNGGFLGIKDLKRKGKQALYRTSLELIKKPKTENLFYIVNVLDIQDYLKGVVPNEMPTSFGLEALKAQAVAARNYVLSPRTRLVNEYDVVDSVASQVYYGANTEEKISNKAVDETDGIVATHNWELILAQYSSTAGGYTESFSNAFSDANNKKFPSIHKPYLVAKPDMISQLPLKTEEEVREFYTTKPDSYDIRSPYYRWQKNWTKEELEEVLTRTLKEQSKTGFVTPKFESEENIKLIDLRPKRRGDSGKLIDLEIVTDKGIYTVQKELVIRRIFQKNNISLPSANVVFEFVIDENNEILEINAYGGGFGHGVGMSQYGAGFMGKELKMPYDKILKHYYTGISLGTEPIILSAYPTQQKVTQRFYLDYKAAELVIDNKFRLSKINLTINGREMVLPLSQELFSFKTPIRIDISDFIKKGENEITFCYPLDEGSIKAVRLYVEAINPHADKFGF